MKVCKALFLSVLVAAIMAAAGYFNLFAAPGAHEADQRIARQLAQARVELVRQFLAHKRAAFAMLAQALPAQALDQLDANSLSTLLEVLQQLDPDFISLDIIDPYGQLKTEAGHKGTSATHEAFPWFRDATRSQETAGGLYSSSDGQAEVMLSRRLTRAGFGTHLRARATLGGLPAAFAPDPALGEQAFLVSRQGDVMGIAQSFPSREDIQAGRTMAQNWPDTTQTTTYEAVGIGSREASIHPIIGEDLFLIQTQELKEGPPIWAWGLAALLALGAAVLLLRKDASTDLTR